MALCRRVTGRMLIGSRAHIKPWFSGKLPGGCRPTCSRLGRVGPFLIADVRSGDKLPPTTSTGLEVIGFLAFAAASALQCPAEDAHYVLRHAPEVSAYFRKVDSGPDWPSGLALAIHFEKSNHTFWWLPWNGMTDNRQNVASTTDVNAPDWRPPNPDGGPRPYGDMEYLGLDAKYDIINHLPARGKTAPAHMLLAHAGDAEFNHGAGNSVPDTKQFFDIVSCSVKSR